MATYLISFSVLGRTAIIAIEAASAEAAKQYALDVMQEYPQEFLQACLFSGQAASHALFAVENSTALPSFGIGNFRRLRFKTTVKGRHVGDESRPDRLVAAEGTIVYSRSYSADSPLIYVWFLNNTDDWIPPHFLEDVTVV